MLNLRFSIPFYLFSYFTIFFLWRWAAFYRQTGKNPIIIGDSGTPHGYLGLWLQVVALLVAVEAVTIAAFPRLYEAGILKSWGMPAWAINAGILLWVVSLMITAIAQIQMGTSWRVGFNTVEKTKLIQDGLYRYSRNPIYAGMLMVLIGLFLVLSNTLSFILLVLGYVLLQITVRLEEAHLLSLYGADYAEYLKRVRRWL